MFQVQETDLMTLAKGGDSLGLQFCLTATGIAAGSLPGATGAVLVFLKDPSKLDLTSLAALVLFVAGIAIAAVCGFLHSRHRSYPEQLLQTILSRQQSPVLGEDA
jgi:hypothetical protein